MNRANLPSTAPDGYRSNQAAIVDLIRFGPAIMTGSELLVVLFHAERSTVMGRASDMHSYRDALKGIYSMPEGRWIRGPAGVSRTTWLRTNAKLVRRGFLRSWRRTWRGVPDPNEYEVVWTALAAAFAKWRESESEARGMFNLEPLEKEA